MMKTVKKIFAVLLAVGLLLSAAPLLALPGVNLTANAATVVETGTCGSGSHYDEETEEWTDTTVTYTLYSDGLLLIEGEGEMKNYLFDGYDESDVEFWDREFSPFYNNTAVKRVQIGDGVESIGEGAFYGCTEMTSLSFADSVSVIGSYAFYGCEKLAAIPAENTIGLIADYAFYGCKSLTSVTLPGHYYYPDGCLFEIGEKAFYGCAALCQLNINAVALYKLGAKAFHNTAWYNAQPDGLIYFCEYLGDYIYAYAYKGEMPENTTLTIADGTRKIVGEAFENCFNLTEIVLPDSIWKIGDRAFENCFNLTEIVLPDSIREIGDRAFGGCAGLQRISLSEAECEIGEGIFAGCTALETIETRESQHNWVENKLHSKGACLIDSYGILLAGSRNSVIPDDGSVKAIASYAFEGPWLNAPYVAMMKELHNAETEWIKTIEVLAEQYEAGTLELTEVQVYAYQDLLFLSQHSMFVDYAYDEQMIGQGEYQYVSEKLTEAKDFLEEVKTGAVTYNSTKEFETAFEKRFEELEPLLVDIIAAVESMSEKYDWETVVIPDGVKVIGTAAFNQTGVKNVVIPQSVKRIGLFDGHGYYNMTPWDDDFEGYFDSFAGSDDMSVDYLDFVFGDALEDVYFTGSEEEWNDIVSQSEALNYSYWLGENVTVHFNFDINHCPHDKTTEKNPVAATCTAQGYAGDICCAICGKKLADGEAVPTRAHLLKQTDAVAPTCTAPGYEAYQTCVVCGGIFDESGATVTEDRLFVSELGHTQPDENGCCQRCGVQIRTDEPDGEVCPQCGKVHGNDLMGRLLSFFHRILYFFTHLLGR